MNKETLEQHMAELTAKGWEFGVPFFHIGFDEFVADKEDMRIVGRATIFNESKIKCVKNVLHYERLLEQSLIKIPRFKFINDPLEWMFQAAEELWPDIDFLIQYDHELKMTDNEFGHTLFPDDGSIAIISINPMLTVADQIEVIGHEIAHVKAGADAGHGEVWERHFQEIHDQFTELYKSAYADAQEEDA
jgi:hypothetical protein